MLGRYVYVFLLALYSTDALLLLSIQPVLLKRVYFESLGILVNAALLRVLVEIENQEDISEESSHRLNDLCKMLHELETLFMDGEQVSASPIYAHKHASRPDPLHFVLCSRLLLYMYPSGLSSNSCRNCLKRLW